MLLSVELGKMIFYFIFIFLYVFFIIIYMKYIINVFLKLYIFAQFY